MTPMTSISTLEKTPDVMARLLATPVVKNKFWIVERDGEKIATIQAHEDDGFVWVEGDSRKRFATIKMIKDRYNIEFAKSPPRHAPSHEIYGFPTVGKPYNALYNLALRLPIYSKESKSKSFYCAGYYLVKINSNWTRAYCPKLITLQRYDYAGPYATTEQQEQVLREKNGL